MIEAVGSGILFFGTLGTILWSMHAWIQDTFPAPFIPVSEGVQLVLQLMKDSCDWKRDTYWLKHKSGISIWISNGASCLDLKRSKYPGYSKYPMNDTDVPLNYEEKRRLWKAVKQYKDVKPDDSIALARMVKDYYDGTNGSSNASLSGSSDGVGGINTRPRSYTRI